MHRSGRITGFHVSLCQQKTRVCCARFGERVSNPIRSCRCALCLSGVGSCFRAEPDIHLLPQAPKSRRRRLSLCSLPVPKQTEESLGSRFRRPAGNLRDLAACASIDPDAFSLPRKGF
jgi:hypothetical protein